MSRRFNLAIAIALAACASRPASAQLGTIPEKSPFRDVEYNHEWTFFTGYLSNKADPAGVAPGGGPIVGLRYDYHFSGPLFGYVRLTGVNSSRIALNPGKPVAKRLVGEFSWPMVFADFGLETSLTGQKAWHGFMPVVSFGGGIYSDLISGSDIGGFVIGSGFMFSLGGGIRYAPVKRLQLRVEAYNYLYGIDYPTSYVNAPVGGTTAILPTGSSPSKFRSNWSLQIGAAYTFLR